jgi:protein ImuB
MLWIALHLPALPLESFAATLDDASRERPLGLLEGPRLAAVNAAAAAQGVQLGMGRATALALAPQLVLGRAEAAREAQALQAVAHACLAFTPSVTLQGPHTVLLEVRTTLRLFGGLAALRQRLRAALRPLGHTWREACASTALGAALLARWGQPGLRPPVPPVPPVLPASPLSPASSASPVSPASPVHANCPPPAHPQDLLQALRARLDAAPVALLVELAGGPPAHAQALQGMGVCTLAELRALPRAGLARRVGPALLEALDRARGDAPDPREWVTLPEAFDARLELFARADTAVQLLHGAGVLLARLVAWARGRQARVQRCSLVMQHEPRHLAESTTPASTTLELALAEPCDDAAHLQRLLRERLAQLELPAPTLELRLHGRELVWAPPPSGELFPTRASQHEGLVRLLERLQARLGAQQVRQLRCVADHRPERAAGCQALNALAVSTGRAGLGLQFTPSTPSTQPGLATTGPLARPAWLLETPQPLHEQHHHPLLEGRPLQLLAGPERIETGWWDGEPALRDYFIAQAHDGTLVWVYRTRLPGTQEAEGWFLHGRFA